MKKLIASLLLSTTLLPLGIDNQVVTADDIDNDPKTEEKNKSTYEQQPIVGYVEYQGKKVAVREETSEVKNAKEAKSGSNSEMGSTFEIKRIEPDAFNLGDPNKPRQDFIDVSSYQSGLNQSHFDYMKSKGITGVVVKLTEGTWYRNPYARQQIQMARNAGMKVSTYHFSRFKNKQQAEAEADYYAAYARELGLGNDTLMVNDAESGELVNGYGTQNSVYFALRLIRHHGFNQVLHYMSGSWCGGVLDPNALGNNSLWIAGYPYTPSKDRLQYTNREAWQFSPNMRIPNYNGAIDVNIDYTGRFTSRREPSETKVHEFYQVWNGNGWTFNDRFINVAKQSTASMKDKIYEARGYIEVNGAKWYSLFDYYGNWMGWTHEYDLRHVEEPQETKVNMTAQVWNGNGWTFNDRFITTARQSTKNMKDKVYTIRGYIVVNGAKWYSLFDNAGNWMGWTHEYDLRLEPQETKVNTTVQVWNGNGWTFNDRFITNARQSTRNMKDKVYTARGYIEVNGAKWYSLFDNAGNWMGWTHEYDLRLEPQETKINTTVQVWNGNGWTFNDRFITNARQSTRNMKDKVYTARGYIVVNGAKWYSLFDNAGNWMGWTHEYDLNFRRNRQEESKSSESQSSENSKVKENIPVNDHSSKTNINFENNQSNYRVIVK